ncbi:MAG: S9 family peptidase [Gammaproteobacteria bacterium]|nr:S9 family peptidase [Gammaproteobacteria bacterium]
MSAPAIGADKLPVEDFVRNADFEMIKISPDGKRFAATYREGTEVKLRVINRKKMVAESNFEFGKYHRVTEFHWVNNKRLVMSERKFVGFLDTKGGPIQLYASDYNGKNRMYLGAGRMASQGSGGTQFRVIDLLENDPDYIVVGQFNADGVRPFRMNVNNGRKHFMGSPRMTSNKSFSAGSAVDHDGNLRLVIEAADGGERLITHYLPSNSDDWQILDLGSRDKESRTLPAGLSRDSSKMMLTSNHDESTSGIFEYDIDNGSVELLFRDPKVDASDVFSATDNTLLGIRYMPGRTETLWLNPDHPEAQAIIGLQKAFPGQDVQITSHTKDATEWVVLVDSDTNPGDFYIYDRESNKLKYLVSRRPWIKPEQMAEQRPIKITARDGLELRGYLTLPPGKEAKDLPLVVNVHGGPHGPRDTWGYNWENQFLANRGYAVLQINFRGSGGYGREFQQAGYRNWGTSMQDDVTDATLWAVDQGIADRNRLCIYGGSYGGYAALQGVVREPDLYKCAIGYVGVYDMFLFNKCGDIPETKFGRDYLAKVISTDEDEWTMRSPARNAEKIKAAVFLAHGEDDVRVPMCQGEAMKTALEKAGKDFIWMQKDEGHGYQKLENRVDFYGTMEKFLAEHIGT